MHSFIIRHDPYTAVAMPRAPVRRITRFTVMATLQAARVRRLGLSENSAYSWGLNRAIFYAAAKRGFGGTRPPTPTGEPGPRAEAEKNLYSLGNDEAYRDPTARELLFTIGGETQTPEAFRKQVAARFGDPRNFDRAWKEAMTIVEGFDEPTLRSGRDFYSTVYKPRRDALVAKWSEEFLGHRTGEPAG
jgi:hypothetical protein